ncbi:hypothetical protein EPUL_004452 [Erysiphe pulchra]|uniref:Centrosomin N-terminal motif 1 domain-containing protein n=1 Tax=Erysiphe pulchra TaxID=225359 RepID=A0A2S4PSX3_9PEZI|nr:hypothetical protein EPUL_004452 [Erysiphe pulchra]
MSPSSSSSSTPYFTQFRGVTPILTGTCTGGSSLLQERLRERNTEGRKSVNFNDGSNLGSPIRSLQVSDERRPSSSGLGAKGMGVKQWEEQISTLHKQNYNLKLELFHRRDRQSKLEAQLEAAQKIIEQQSEYQEINNALLVELDRRDQAVDEAINLITSLEEQIELLKEENQRLRQGEDESKEFEAESYRSLSPHQNRPRRSSVSSKQISQSRPLPRVPSFLSEQSEGTEALRSLYIKCPAPSEQTLSKLDEEEDGTSHDAIDSPRLSVLSGLSESSFVSVYGDKYAEDDNLSVQSLEQQNKNIDSSILKWAEKALAPSISPSWTPPLHKTQFNSLNKVINSPLVQRPGQVSVKKEKNLVVDTQILRSVSSGFNRFNDRHVLPPTPDTFCTAKLRADSRHSNEIPPYEKDGMTNYATSLSQKSLPLRPQSACETITSRRDGHGWDTPSETEAGSVVNSEDASFHQSRPKRVKTPTLFSFNESNWDYNTAYHQESELFYNSHQGSLESINDTSVRDFTEKHNESHQFSTRDNSRSPTPLNEQQLSQNIAKGHVSQTTKEEQEVVSNSPVIAVSNNLSPTWKRNPISLTFARLRRHDLSITNSQLSLVRIKSVNRAHSSVVDKIIGCRNATPPPILRHRDQDLSIRPRSAGSGLMLGNEGFRDVIQEQREERHRRVTSFSNGSATQRETQLVETERDEEHCGGKGMRKWLGLGVGRSNSLRKS